MYIQANIGRNITTNLGVRPMGDIAWETFQQDVKEEIFLAVHDVNIPFSFEISMDAFQVHTGTGEWEGVKEESAHISIYFESSDPTVVTEREISDTLAKRLSYLAFQYGQDAIAFVVTDSHLATR